MSIRMRIDVSTSTLIVKVLFALCLHLGETKRGQSNNPSRDIDIPFLTSTLTSWSILQRVHEGWIKMDAVTLDLFLF